MVAAVETYGSGPAVRREPLSGALSLRDLAVQAFYNARIIIGCLLLGLALGIAGAMLSKTQYTADSLLLIRTSATDGSQQGIAAPPLAVTDAAVQRIIQSDIQILQSDPVVRRAVDAVGVKALARPGLLARLGIARRNTGEREVSQAVDAFRRKLRITSEPNSNIVKVSFTHEDRALAIKAVQALVDAYGDRRAAMYLDSASALQAQEMRRYADDLRSIENQIQAVRNRYGVLDIAQDITLAGTSADALAQRASQSRERLSAVQAELGATASSLRSSPRQVFDSDEQSNATPNDDARNTLLRLRQDRAHMATQYTDNWPGLRELDEKIAAAQAQVASNANDRTRTQRTVRNPVLDALNTRYASLGIERQALVRQIGELERQRREAEARISSLREADQQLRDLQRTREVMEGIYRQLSVNQVGARLQNEQVDDRNASLRVVQPATAPLKGRSLAPTFLLAGMLFGVVAAAAASGVATLSRQVFITPGEAERALRAPNLAEFDAASADFASDRGREAIERFATYLLDAEVDGRPLQVIGLVAGDAAGKSDFALAVGKAMAREHNQRTLLIDFDAEDHFERMAKKASATNTLPLSGCELTVARASTPQFWIALDARKTALGDSRAPAPRVKDCLVALKGGFDRVLIVGQKDFAQYGARRLYPLADANVLMINGEKTRAPVVRQMQETVLSSGGDVLGFVYTDRQYYVPEAVYKWL